MPIKVRTRLSYQQGLSIKQTIERHIMSKNHKALTFHKLNTTFTFHFIHLLQMSSIREPHPLFKHLLWLRYSLPFNKRNSKLFCSCLRSASVTPSWYRRCSRRTRATSWSRPPTRRARPNVSLRWLSRPWARSTWWKRDWSRRRIRWVEGVWAGIDWNG